MRMTLKVLASKQGPLCILAQLPLSYLTLGTVHFDFNSFVDRNEV